MSNQNLQYTLSLKDLFTGKMNNAINKTEKLDSKISGLGSRIKTAFAGIAVGYGIREIVNATTQFQSLENAINATGQGRGAENLKFLNEQVDRLGMDLKAAYNGYKTFSGALMGTSLSGDKGNNIFRQVSEAATVMGLSGEQSEGAFLALGQMMSKGTVSAEELRGQLGERIPGAFQIAAKAMGVTTQKLGEMMQKGELVATDFLPKFGDELEKRFGKQASGAANSLQSNLNRMYTEFERLKVQIGNDFMPVIIAVTQKMAIFFRWIKNNLSTIKFFGTLILGLFAAFKLYQGILVLSTLWTGVKFLGALVSLSAGLQGATVAQYALNLAMDLCPVLALVSLFVLLIKTIKDYKSIAELHSESVQVQVNKGLENEIALVNKLSDSLQKKGISQKMANKAALEESKSALAYDINYYKSKLAEGKISPRVAELQIASMQGRLKAINNPNIFNKGTSDLTSMSSAANTKKLGVGASETATRPQNLYISIDKLVETLNIKAATIKESASKMKEEVSKALLEAVNDINYITR